MNTKYSLLFNELESNRQSLFEELDRLDQDKLTFKENNSSWSILQVCHHLIISEELSLQYLNKKLQYDTPIPKANIGSVLRSTSMNLALHLPYRFSAPSRVAQFPENLEWAALKNRWINVRHEMKNKIEKVPDDYLKKLVYKHPSIGRLTLYQMLSFFKTHIYRHQKQIKRLIKQAQDKDRSHH